MRMSIFHHYYMEIIVIIDQKYLKMEPKIKISKQLANFMQPRTNRDRQKQNEQKSANRPKTEKDQSSQSQPSKQQQQNAKKKSRNPFGPIHDWIKFSKEIDAKINSARQGIEMERLSKLSFLKNSDLNQKQEQLKDIKQQVRYEDCLTLQVIKKNQNYCLKKILHVPTLTLFYLRESAIDFSTDKHQIEEWMKKCNQDSQKEDSASLPILKLYWNVPESYYSILYEYKEGIMFQAALDNMSTLPLLFLKKMIGIFLDENYQIFNSQLLITKGQQVSTLKYLPIYQEVDDIIPHQRNFRQLLQIDSRENEGDEKMVARIGLFVLLGYFGDTLVDEDISCIFFENQMQCCLMHRMLDNPSSLIKFYIQCNLNSKDKQKEKQYLIDFLCKCMKTNSKARSSISDLKKHKFLKLIDSESYTMEEVIRSLEFSGNSRKSFRANISKDLSQHKMNRVLESISGILQGSKQSKKEIDFTSENSNIRGLVREFGMIISENEMDIACADLIKKLKRIYEA